MLKTLLLTLTLGSTYSLAIAQNNCDNGRYKDPIFNEVKVTSAVEFGSAKQLIDLAGPTYTPVLQDQKLYMDIYEPVGDSQEKRPLIIFAFGGAFVFGTRTDAYMVDLCTRYAKLGYVTASIDYRLTRELALAGTKLDPAIAPKAVLKGTHDMKASVRYFNYTAEFGNPYRIDASQIYVSGVSAGALCALHTAYLDKDDEIPELLKPYAEENGGINGLSGYLAYSSKVAGVISFSGALGEATWLEPGDVPLVSTHGTADAVVPYGSDSVTILLINYPVDGSSVIHERANQIGVRNAFYTYYGAAHAQEASNVAYRDTGFAFTSAFMYQLVCEKANGIADNELENIQLYPNPAKEITTLTGLKQNTTLEVYTSAGQLVYKETTNLPEHKLQTSAFVSGLYFVRISNSEQSIRKQLLIE